MDDPVRDYRDAMDAEYQPVFDRLHRLILATCPDAEVALAYDMPAYRIGRRRIPDEEFQDLIRAALRS